MDKIKSIAIVGSRSITDLDVLKDCLKQCPEFDYIVSGGAAGVDSLANDYAKEKGLDIKIIYPKWRDKAGNYDKGAGFKRNVRIVDESDFVLILWDSESSGAIHDISLTISKRKPMKLFVIGEPTKEFKKDKIEGFVGKEEWLSNYWPCEVEVAGMKFKSVENAFYASMFFKSKEIMREIAAAPQLDARRIARQHFLDKSEGFDEGHAKRKVEIMGKLVWAKFIGNEYLQKKLLLTGNVPLINSNKIGEAYWGVVDGVGENMLGKILEIIRDHFRSKVVDTETETPKIEENE